MAPTSTSHDFPAYVEPERHDELSRGVPAARGGTQKREAGRFTPGPNGSAVAAGAAGGSGCRSQRCLWSGFRFRIEFRTYGCGQRDPQPNCPAGRASLRG